MALLEDEPDGAAARRCARRGLTGSPGHRRRMADDVVGIGEQAQHRAARGVGPLAADRLLDIFVQRLGVAACRRGAWRNRTRWRAPTRSANRTAPGTRCRPHAGFPDGTAHRPRCGSRPSWPCPCSGRRRVIAAICSAMRWSAAIAAASGSKMRRISCTDFRKRSRSGAPMYQTSTSRSSRFQCSRGSTRVPTFGPRADQALGHQHLHGFAHGRAAHAQALAPFGLIGQQLARAQSRPAGCASRSPRRRRNADSGPALACESLPVSSAAQSRRLPVSPFRGFASRQSNRTAMMMQLPMKVPCQNVLMPSKVRLLRMTSIERGADRRRRARCRCRPSGWCRR